jgi:hypothetical protein
MFTSGVGNQYWQNEKGSRKEPSRNVVCTTNGTPRNMTMLKPQRDMMKTLKIQFAGICAITTVLALTLALTPQFNLWAADDEIPEFTHDGLQRVIDSKAALAYVKPGADLSVYNQFMILDCYVAFKKNWQRDYNRDQLSLSGQVSDNDMERMKKDMAELFREVVVAELSENDGYELVDEPAGNVLLIRPAIIDLEATAPDTGTAGRSYTFVDSAGAATLFIELYDSVSGEILARAIDRKADRNHGRMEWANRGSGRAAARRILRTWAGWLRERMDEIHDKAG